MVHVKPNWNRKRGYFIYGEAGLGKTTLAKKLAILTIREYNYLN